jgi:hypothetical protein
MNEENQLTEFNENIEAELICIDARQLLSINRLDVVVRFLFFREILKNNSDFEIESLYARTMLSRHGASEALSFFSFDNKQGITSFIANAKKLLVSIKEEGFKKEYYVPLAKDLGLYNGAHRIAACMALNEKVWIRYCGENGIKDFTFEWFDKNNFSFNDKVRILRGFADLYQKNLGVYLLYGTIKEKWDYIQTQISYELDIAGFIDIDLRHNFIAFENLIKDIYLDYSSEGTIAEKIKLLKLAPLIVRVILVVDNKSVCNYPPHSHSATMPEAFDSNTDDFYVRMISLKKDIRKLLHFDIDENVALTLHGSDTRQEYIYLKNILLSVNNLCYIEKRIYQTYRTTFLEWIKDFKAVCEENDIPIENTCIAGSSSLEVVGIRQSTDIDFTVTGNIRNKYGDGVTHLTDNIDIVTRNYVRVHDSVLISDDELIQNDNYHFYFAGCKFTNIDLVYYRKNAQRREKDLMDVRLIELYNDFYKYFTNKSILQQQIEKELIRRNIKICAETAYLRNDISEQLPDKNEVSVSEISRVPEETPQDGKFVLFVRRLGNLIPYMKRNGLKKTLKRIIEFIKP